MENDGRLQVVSIFGEIYYNNRVMINLEPAQKLKKKRRFALRILLLLVIVLLVLVVVLSFWAGNFLFSLALDRDSDKGIVFNNLEMNDYDPEVYEGIEDGYKQLRSWAESLPVEHVYVESADGTELHSLWLRAEEPSSRWCIDIHGYYGNAEMGYVAKEFRDRGYNMVAPDLRGHGESGGRYMTMGWGDHLDLVRYVEMIVEQDPEADIVLFGVSMGAATVLMASGEALPENVRCIVEDCGYTSVDDEFAYQLRHIFNMPPFPLLYTANVASVVHADLNFFEASALEQVKKSQTPTLFIHGDRDDFVPLEMVYELYDAANVEKELYIVPGALHAGSVLVDGTAYWERVFGFIDRYIER